jgi:uncharacterized membrane protein YozB (DUF420 family)
LRDSCYLVYHAQVGSMPFPKTGAVRTLYLSILATHTTLAAAVPVLAILTLRRGLTARLGILPTINAFLNATATVLLVWGFILIRRKRIQQSGLF